MLQHQAAIFWDGLGSLGSPLWTMAGKWVLTVDCMRICLFNDSVLFLIVNGGFQHFSVIVLQEFISIKLSVLYYPQSSPRFRWFCSGALLGFSRCFTCFKQRGPCSSMVIRLSCSGIRRARWSLSPEPSLLVGTRDSLTAVEWLTYVNIG